MLPRRAAVLKEDFLGAGTCGAETLLPRREACFLKGRERPCCVDRAPLEVPRVRCTTSAQVAQTSAPTAGESEARVCSQEEQDVSAGMSVETAKDAQFMRGSSAEQVTVHVTP